MASGVAVAPEEDGEKASRYLAYLLRHHPEDAGLTLDPKGGWVAVSELLAGVRRASRGRRRWSEEYLSQLVSSQRRFALRDGRICARRGHSVAGITPLHRLREAAAERRSEVEGERRGSRRVRRAGILQPIEPPESLFLAVGEKSLRRALAGDGLRLRRGEFLKLFADWPSAARQAKRLRRGRVVVVAARKAWAQGVSFFEGRRGSLRVAFLPRRFLRGGDRGLERQRAAGCVVVRRPRRGAAEFILIRTRPRGGVVEARDGDDDGRGAERRQALEAFLESWAAQGRLELPKGKIEQGETAEGAALRELREETGIHTPLSVICPLPTVSYVFRQADGRAVSKSIHFFLVRSDDADPVFMPQDPEGIVAVEWHPPEAALEKVAFENLRPILRAARDLVRRGADLAAG